jgi:hypothetical protein
VNTTPDLHVRLDTHRGCKTACVAHGQYIHRPHALGDRLLYDPLRAMLGHLAIPPNVLVCNLTAFLNESICQISRSGFCLGGGWSFENTRKATGRSSEVYGGGAGIEEVVEEGLNVCFEGGRRGEERRGRRVSEGAGEVRGEGERCERRDGWCASDLKVWMRLLIEASETRTSTVMDGSESSEASMAALEVYAWT